MIDFDRQVRIMKCIQTQGKLIRILCKTANVNEKSVIQRPPVLYQAGVFENCKTDEDKLFLSQVYHEVFQERQEERSFTPVKFLEALRLTGKINETPRQVKLMKRSCYTFKLIKEFVSS